MRGRGALLAIPLALGCEWLPAAETSFPSWYIGAGIGRAEYGGEETETNFDQIDDEDGPDDSQTIGKMFGGYRFGPNLSVEVSYQELGTYDSSVLGQTGGAPGTLDRLAEADAFSIAVLGHYTLKSGSFFARLGAARWGVESTATASTGITTQRLEDDDSGTDLVWGIGYEHRIGDGALRVGYEEFANVAINEEEDDVRALAFDILVRF